MVVFRRVLWFHALVLWRVPINTRLNQPDAIIVRLMVSFQLCNIRRALLQVEVSVDLHWFSVALLAYPINFYVWVGESVGIFLLRNSQRECMD